MKKTIILFAMIFSSIAHAICNEPCDIRSALNCLHTDPSSCNKAMGLVMDEVLKNQAEIMKKQDEMLRMMGSSVQN